MRKIFTRRRGLGTGTGASLAVLLALSAASAPAASDLISTVAGNGSKGFLGEGVLAVNATFDEPADVAAVPGGGVLEGGFLIADAKNHAIRHVSPLGFVTRVAGTGSPGDGGGLTPLLTELDEPRGVAALPDGDGYLIADTKNHVIRKVDGLGLTISTVAGTGSQGYDADDDDADEADLNEPHAVAPLPDGGFLIADTGNHVIRKVTSGGEISTVAGTSSSGFSDGGGQARQAKLTSPTDVVPTPQGGFVIADTGNHRVRRVSAAGTIFTVAGNGVEGFNGDGIPALAAKLDDPSGVALTPPGGYLIADRDNDRLREVPPGGIIRTVAGSTPGYGGDGGLGTSGLLEKPRGIAIGDGGVLIADALNHAVRLLDLTFTVLDTPGTSEEGGGGEGAGRGDEKRVELPPASEPKRGETFVGGVKKGQVRVKLPGSKGFVELDEDATLPDGTVVDSRKGVVALTVASPSGEGTQSGTFNAGLFQLRQPKGKPFTQLALRGGRFASCARRTRRAARRSASASSTPLATTTARRKRGSVRKLWGRAKGNFKTRGRNGSATVRGTVWLTADRCDGTLVKVRKGVVDVKPNRGGKAVAVRAGERLLVRKRP